MTKVELWYEKKGGKGSSGRHKWFVTYTTHKNIKCAERKQAELVKKYGDDIKILSIKEV